MLIFSKVRWKNFLSTGDVFSEIDLNQTKLTLLVGANGSGKSTVLDAICYALFGKAYRNINKPQLVNSINGRDCLVEIEFTAGGVPFKVCRGQKPGIFEIYQSGVLINQTAASKDYQKYLEQQVLKLNFKSFTQVAILGSAAFTPFMQLPSGQRREVIEDLLDISVFGRMQNILKERGRDIKDDYKKITMSIQNAEKNKTTCELFLQNIADAKAKEATNFDERIDEKRNLVKAANVSLTLHSRNLARHNDEIADLKKQYDTLDEEIKREEARLHTEHKMKHTTKDLLENTTSCPLCLQEMSLDDRDKTLSTIDEELRSIATERNTLREKRTTLMDIQTKTEGIRQKLSFVIETCTKLASDISTLNTEIKSLEEEKKRAASTNDGADVEQELKKIEVELQAANDAKTEMDSLFGYHTVIFELLKDSGIKTKIIKHYIPIINKWINAYLQTLDFFVHFSLDETFSESILSRHRDQFTYASFSEGEKQKINLAIMFAWRQIAQLKNSLSTNLLILDETFDSSLDADGVENLLRIFESIDEKTNVIVISHRGVNESAFGRVLKAEKQNNFSTIG